MKTTAGLGELDPISSGATEHQERSPVLNQLVADWKNNRSRAFAADLVSAAFSVGQFNVAEDAAAFLLSDKGASAAARQVAARLLDLPSGSVVSEASLSIKAATTEDKRAAVQRFRRRTIDDPRNSLAWVDLSRAYTNLGHSEKAHRAMQNAVALAPSNRFVLRSSSRLLVHYGDRQKAHDLLRRAVSTRFDPWILAAEISAGALAGRTSRFVRTSREMIESRNFSPFHLAELRSALATLELNAGNSKRSRKLFRMALEKPTENAVAQAQWASEHLNGLNIPLEHPSLPLSHEANTHSFFLAGAWRESLGESWNWLHDEPFSIHPAAFGSYLALEVLEDYQEGERLAKAGLIANKDDPILLNNLAVSLAAQGRTAEAQEMLRRVGTSGVDDGTKVCLLATQGFIHFRLGQFELGTKLYQEAMVQAETSNLAKYRARAALNLAREQVLASLPTAAHSAEQAIRLCRPFLDPDVKAALDHFVKLLGRIGGKEAEFSEATRALGT